jgi:hypothetical protein
MPITQEQLKKAILARDVRIYEMRDEIQRLRDFARAAVVAFDLAAELMPDNVINFAQFAEMCRAALPQE